MPLTTLKIFHRAGGFRLVGLMFTVTLVSTPVILMCFARGDVGLAWRLFLVWWPGLLMFALLPVAPLLLLVVIVAIWRFVAPRQ
jgi:hypothetical protein